MGLSYAGFYLTPTMQLSDFDYSLPQELIAQKPLSERSASRLLLLDPSARTCSDRQFADIVDLVDAGDLLVFNDTLVIPARLFGRKAGGGRIEVLVERVLDDGTLLAHVRASKAPKPGAELNLEDGMHPNEAGHRLLAANVVPALADLLRGMAAN